MRLTFRTLPTIVIAALLTTSQMTSAWSQTEAELRAALNAGDIARMEHFARSGNARAQGMLYIMLAQRRRPVEAEEWRLRAAESGDTFTIRNLASEALGKRDFAEAARWHRRGAELGHRDSQVSYAWVLRHGRGVERNEREAFRWYLSAANLGHPASYLVTAEMYAAGQGVERDPIAALAHVEIALRVLDPTSDQDVLQRARTLRERLVTELSPERIEQARAKAREKRPDAIKP
jgi:TPR repeat protein